MTTWPWAPHANNRDAHPIKTPDQASVTAIPTATTCTAPALAHHPANATHPRRAVHPETLWVPNWPSMAVTCPISGRWSSGRIRGTQRWRSRGRRQPQSSSTLTRARSGPTRGEKWNRTPRGSRGAVSVVAGTPFRDPPTVFPRCRLCECAVSLDCADERRFALGL